MDMYNNLLISFFCINKTNFKYFRFGVCFVPPAVGAPVMSIEVAAWWVTSQARAAAPHAAGTPPTIK